MKFHPPASAFPIYLTLFLFCSPHPFPFIMLVHSMATTTLQFKTCIWLPCIGLCNTLPSSICQVRKLKNSGCVHICIYMYTHTILWRSGRGCKIRILVLKVLQAKQARFRELDCSAKKEKGRNRCDALIPIPIGKLRNTCSKVLAQAYPHL